MISALFHCILWSSSHKCSATLDLDIALIFVLLLCSVILVLCGLCMGRCKCSCFLDLIFWFIVFVSILRSVVCDLNAVRIPNLYPNSVNLFRYSPDVKYYHGTFRDFLIGRVPFLVLTEDFIYEFWWIFISY
jgi:hypothetical protein